MSDIEAIIQKGLDAYSLGDDALAIELWKQVLAVDPDNKVVLDYISHAEGVSTPLNKGAQHDPDRKNTFAGRTSTHVDSPVDGLTQVGHGLHGYGSLSSDNNDISLPEDAVLSEEELVRQILDGSAIRHESGSDTSVETISDPSPRASRATILTFSDHNIHRNIHKNTYKAKDITSRANASNNERPTSVDQTLSHFLVDEKTPIHAKGPLSEVKHISTDVNPDDDAIMKRATEMYESGSYETAYFLCQEAQKLAPRHEEAIRLQTKTESKLSSIYYRQIGDLEATPKLKVIHNDILWADLDHKAGFIISLIDGNLSFTEILDVCAMPPFDALRIFAQLRHLDVI